MPSKLTLMQQAIHDVETYRATLCKEREKANNLARAHKELTKRHRKLYAEHQRVLNSAVDMAGEINNLRNQWKVQNHAFNYSDGGSPFA